MRTASLLPFLLAALVAMATYSAAVADEAEHEVWFRPDPATFGQVAPGGVVTDPGSGESDPGDGTGGGGPPPIGDHGPEGDGETGGGETGLPPGMNPH